MCKYRGPDDKFILIREACSAARTMLLADLPGDSRDKLLFPIYRSLALTPAKTCYLRTWRTSFRDVNVSLVFFTCCLSLVYARERLSIITAPKSRDCLRNVSRRIDSPATIPGSARIRLLRRVSHPRDFSSAAYIFSGLATRPIVMNN